MAGIASYGAYVPIYRLPRKEIGQAWGIPAMSGERSVGSADEDSITMSVAAALQCLAGVEPGTVDGVYFATTTSPYLEKQGASIIAGALDLRDDIVTADFTDSTRAATIALRAAVNAVDSGALRNVLVVAADLRLGEPGTNWEMLLGDGSAALLVTPDGAGVIRGFTSVTNSLIGPWRLPSDPYVRSFEGKQETEYGYQRSMAQAAKSLLQKEELTPKEITKAAFYSPDPRSVVGVARTLGLEARQIQDTLFAGVGNTGAAQALMVLAGALEEAKEGDRILAANYGDGADAFLVELKAPLPQPAGKVSLSRFIETKRYLPNYAAYAGRRRIVVGQEPMQLRSSPVTYWRDAHMELRLHGNRCLACGLVQYPVGRVCDECGARDQFEQLRLARKGTVYTFTLDHLYGGEYLNTPIPRVVADLEGGGRIFLEMTDADPAEVKPGMPIELCFRWLHQGADFPNYYWKGQPIRG